MIKQVTINECTCAKCKATWLSRSVSVPKVCPRCGNRKWNVDDLPDKGEVDIADGSADILGLG